MGIHIQDTLTDLQIIPLVGPIIFSPIKIVVSVVQIIGNLALAAILSVGALIALCVDPHLSYTLATYTWNSLKESALGWGSLALATINLATIGIAGLIYNTLIRPFTRISTAS